MTHELEKLQRKGTKPVCPHCRSEGKIEMNTNQIIEVGKALLPYLRENITPAELGQAAHDAVVALNRANMTMAEIFADHRAAVAHACGRTTAGNDISGI